MTNLDTKPDFELFVKAYEQYTKSGKPTVKCDKCGETIWFQTSDDQRTVPVECPCGRYKDCMKGL